MIYRLLLVKSIFTIQSLKGVYICQLAGHCLPFLLASGLQIELNKRKAINFSYDTVQNARKAEHVLSITETLFFCKIYDVNS